MIERFVARRRARWERLSELLDRARSPRRRLSVDELDELARLYRQTTGDLAIARRDFGDDRAALFINQLVTRAHGILYRESPAPLSLVWTFFARDLPREFRASWPYLIAAAALFFVPQIAMMIAILISPSIADLSLSPALLAQIKEGKDWFEIHEVARSPAAAFIMTNNMTVSMLALGGGMLGGVGTVAVLLSNAVQLGSVEGALIAYGLGDRLLWWVAAHSFLELSTIVIAGACGLMIGRAIVWSGLEPRGRTLVRAAARATRLTVGCLPLLVVAGLLEGFVSPSDLPTLVKLAIGLFTGVLLYGYLLLVARESNRFPLPLGEGAVRSSQHSA